MSRSAVRRPMVTSSGSRAGVGAASGSPKTLVARSSVLPVSVLPGPDLPVSVLPVSVLLVSVLLMSALPALVLLVWERSSVLGSAPAGRGVARSVIALRPWPARPSPGRLRRLRPHSRLTPEGVRAAWLDGRATRRRAVRGEPARR